jgi:hypothetical protein
MPSNAGSTGERKMTVTLTWTDKSGLGKLYQTKMPSLETALSQIAYSSHFNLIWWIDGIPATTPKQREMIRTAHSKHPASN